VIAIFYDHNLTN